MKNLLGLVAGVTVVVLVQSCGAEDPKKKSYTPYPGGQGGASGAGGKGNGDAGDRASGGSAGKGGSSTGGSSEGGAAGEIGSGGEAGAGLGGQGGAEGGAAGQSGGGGEAGAGGGGSCPDGFGECDDNPDTFCEQDLSLEISCGDCNTTCGSTNGTVDCQNFTCVVTSCNANFGDCDGSGVNGCETSLVSNAANCGQCGRNCAALGSTCATNICNEVPMQQTLGFGTQGRNGLTWAFSSTGIYHATTDNYQIVRYLPDGTTTQVIWSAAGQTAGTASLLLLGTEVLWSQHGTDGVASSSGMFRKDISAMPLDQPIIAWTPEWAPQFLTQQGNTLYWMSGDYQSGDPGGYVYARSATAPSTTAGAKIVTLDQGFHGAVTAFEATSNALFWVTNSAANGVANEIRTTPLAGGTPTAVPPVPGAATTPVYSGSGVSVLQGVGDTLYFSRDVGTELQNGIYRFKAGDVAPTLLVMDDDVRSMHVDGNYIYYTYTPSPKPVGVYRAPITGGVAGVRISDVTGTSFILGSDANYLYVAQTSGTNTNLFKVVK